MQNTHNIAGQGSADDRRAEYEALRAEILYSDQVCIIITGALLSGSLALLTFVIETLKQPDLAALLSPVWLIGYSYISEKRFVIETIAMCMRQCIEKQSGFGWENWLSTERQGRVRFRRVFPYHIETLMSSVAIVGLPFFILWHNEGVAALRIPYAQTFHALGIVKQRLLQDQDTSRPERVPTETLLSRMADAVVATSAAEVHELARMQALGRQVSVVPCGVNTDLFSPDGPSEAKSCRKRIVVVGRLVRRKGVDEVVRALKRLPMAELVIVGGSGGSDPDADRIRALAQAEDVADRVELRGALPHTEIARVLRSADLVVCFPWYEPFGIVAIEAMACGRPVLAAAVGGLAETVAAGTTGILVAAGDSEGLARAADSLLRDETRCARMAEAGRRRAVNLYDWRCVVDRMLEVYTMAQRNECGRVSPLFPGGALR